MRFLQTFPKYRPLIKSPPFSGAQRGDWTQDGEQRTWPGASRRHSARFEPFPTWTQACACTQALTHAHASHRQVRKHSENAHWQKTSHNCVPKTVKSLRKRPRLANNYKLENSPYFSFPPLLPSLFSWVSVVSDRRAKLDPQLFQNSCCHTAATRLHLLYVQNAD